MPAEARRRRRRGDWPSGCPDQMGSFDESGAKVLGISAGTPRPLRTRGENRGVEVALLPGFDREVIEEYGVRYDGAYARRVESSLDYRAEVDVVLEGLETAL